MAEIPLHLTAPIRRPSFLCVVYCVLPGVRVTFCNDLLNSYDSYVKSATSLSVIACNASGRKSLSNPCFASSVGNSSRMPATYALIESRSLD
ncbi:hypothetical protein K457DRAFT_1911507 [Linnemannia elongata AG-77]|uniref:Uncharacterized protein n=1 Tax=Linnemannia elongata AG-77 TaxID=1314771 RepID=A0A197JC87_9FUNG|nr:hypothetical protein K457DRAFT_1911507 [Linnemannia elongata AG-77]